MIYYTTLEKDLNIVQNWLALGNQKRNIDGHEDVKISGHLVFL